MPAFYYQCYLSLVKYGSSPRQVGTLHTKTRGEGRGEPPVVDNDFSDDGWTSAIACNDGHGRITSACQNFSLDGSPAFKEIYSGGQR